MRSTIARAPFALHGIAAATLICTAACTPSQPSFTAQGDWMGTITTDGDVTTVVNESGSVWGGTATLREEASIGVESGDRPYMFGLVTSIWGTDEAIYVVDLQARAVRVFDHDGRWIGSIGRPGQGPGEFLRPETVMTAVDGRVFVYEGYSSRVNVYSPGGEPLETWSLGGVRASGRPVLHPDGRVFLRSIDPGPDQAEHHDDTLGMQEVNAGGAVGPPFTSSFPVGLNARLTAVEGTSANVPFAAAHRSALVPAGAFVGGFSNEYAFEIHWLDGRVTRIERHGDPVPVSADLREYHRRRVEAQLRARNPGRSWDGAEIPAHKPAFAALIPDQSDRILVYREGPSRRIEGCEDHPANPFPGCWRTDWFWDLFTLEGKYLGDVISPVGWASTIFVRDDMWLMEVQDEAGTIMVKRYRLILPGGP
ncbi:MAG TPA: 6-bladed beta-propeller [Acidobacteriota bacterium]